MKESSLGGVECCACTDVCSLPPDQLEARRRMIRSEILPRVLREENLRDGFACEFDAGMRSRLEEWVALERECCSSLDWKVLRAPGGCVRLEVRGTGARAVAQLALGRGKQGSQLRRASGLLAGAGGLGFAGAFFLCCVLPALALAAFGGTALVVSLARLDEPGTIAGFSLLLATLAWWVLRRRARRDARP